MSGATDPPSPEALQDRYAPNNACFGCGPANPDGLQLKSVVRGDEVVAHFRPKPQHQAFPGVLNGGIIGALLDCHSNWTAAHALMRARGEATPPCTVTADFHVKLRAPTPLDRELELRACPVQLGGPRAPVEGGSADPQAVDRCTVDAELSCDGKVTATCRGTFVAVKPGHPAYHRW
jgi:acyl-coenzyme A thioesterase PaaI-like protein